MVESAMRALAVARSTMAALATNRTAVIQRGAEIQCEGCAATAMAPQTTRISRRGVWTGDPAAPDGWGIRYKRRDRQDALATYYCAECAAKVASGEIKV